MRSTPEGISAVVFDMYQTLVRFVRPLRHYEILADEIHRGTDEVRWAAESLSQRFETGKISSEERMRTICRILRVKAEPRRLTKLINLETYECVAASRLYPDALRAIGRIRRAGYKVGLCSNANPIGVATATVHGLNAVMDQMVFSCEVGVAKPHGLIYRTTARRLRANMDTCLYVDDGGSRSLEGAKRLRMTTVLVEHPDGYAANHPEAGLTADYRIEQIAQVADLLGAPVAI